jgi:hypothetical protein
MFYTYLLGWSRYKKYYYGVRYSKHAKTEDVGVTYFSSSKYVKNFIDEFGNPDIIDIRKLFNNKEKALDWEGKVLKRMSVVSDDRFLNRWDNNMVPYNHEGPYPFELEDIQKKVEETFQKKYQGKGSGSYVIKERVFNTNETRYGTHHTLHLEHVIEARKKGSMNMYGVDNPFKSKELQASFENPMHNVKHRKKHKEVMESKDWTDRNAKTKSTNLEKYGISNYMNIPEIKEKHKRSCPFSCNNNHKYDAGNFSNHMMKLHKWSKAEIKAYKNEN